MRRTLLQTLPWLACALMPLAMLSTLQAWWPSLGLAAWLQACQHPWKARTCWWVAALAGGWVDALSGWPLGSHAIIWIALWSLYQTGWWDVSHRSTQTIVALVLMLACHAVMLLTPWRDAIGLTSWWSCLVRAVSTWLVYLLWMLGDDR